MDSRTGIVVTTIFEPAFLQGYLDNLAAHGRQNTGTIYIIPDLKTPPSVAEAAGAAERAGFDVRCPDCDEQQAFLRSFGVTDGFVPWNTDNRRNVGYLMALADGCDVLISIDDDNFCRPDVDFVGEHGQVGAEVRDQRSEVRGQESVFSSQRSVVSGEKSEGRSQRAEDRSPEQQPQQKTRNTQHATRWLNICSMLETNVPVEVYPRGFPYFAREQCEGSVQGVGSAGGTVAINAGLWLDDPDVDAVTRLSLDPKATAVRAPSVVLGRDVWTPVNTQNTALTREAAAAYYYVRMGYPLQGSKIDRYGDILSGYFVQKCAKHLGQAVRVGTPVADHRRTPHNLFKDLHQELAGMAIIEDLVPWLIEEPLEGCTYVEAYASLAERLASATNRFTGFVWDQGGQEFLAETAELMQTWLGAVKKIG